MNFDNLIRKYREALDREYDAKDDQAVLCAQLAWDFERKKQRAEDEKEKIATELERVDESLKYFDQGE